MSEMMDKVVAVKAKKQEAEKAKQEAAEKKEQEGKRSELSAEREKISADMPALEAGNADAEQVLAEVAVLEAEGENDPAVMEELAAIKSEAQEKKTAFAAAKSKLEELTKRQKEIDETESEEAKAAASRPQEQHPAPGGATEKTATETPGAEATKEAGQELEQEAHIKTVEETTEKEKPEEADYEAMSLKELQETMKAQVNAPLKEVTVWYAKIKSESGTLTDTQFAQGQIDKLAEIKSQLDALGPAGVKKLENEGKKSDTLKQRVEKMTQEITALTHKIEDRAMLASETPNDKEALKRIHPETVQEDVDRLNEKVRSLIDQAQKGARIRPFISKKDLPEYEEVQRELEQSTKDLQDQRVFLADIVNSGNPEATKMKQLHKTASELREAAEQRSKMFKETLDLARRFNEA